MRLCIIVPRLMIGLGLAAAVGGMYGINNADYAQPKPRVVTVVNKMMVPGSRTQETKLFLIYEKNVDGHKYADLIVNPTSYSMIQIGQQAVVQISDRDWQQSTLHEWIRTILSGLVLLGIASAILGFLSLSLSDDPSHC